jgi:hypothetical protein
VQALVQPSPSNVLPSSQASSPVVWPSPQPLPRAQRVSAAGQNSNRQASQPNGVLASQGAAQC